jgi:hypothetical protein
MKKIHRTGLSKIALSVALALATLPVLAQNTTSAVGGRITGVDGKPASGAQVTILHNESGSVTNTVTDAEGRYSARGLRVGGPYTITITKAGVTEKRDGVFLLLADTTSVDAKLGGVTQTVETIVVTGKNAGSDKFSTTAMGAGTSFGRAELDTYASIQRNLQDYARIDPRVSQTDKERGEISVGGQNSRYNKITIDGVNISDTFGLEANTLPTLKQPISIDAIQSVQVNISNYDVTQTGYTGGNINAVTKSGTNDFHGSVSYVTRDDQYVGQRYNRVSDIYTDAPKFKENTKGFTLGGPIIKDKLFFYGGYEELRSSRNAPDAGPIGSNAGNIVGILPSTISTAQSLSQSLYKIDVGGFDPAGRELIVKDSLLKLDWNINAQHRASLRYTKTDQTEPIFPNIFTTPTTALSLTSDWYTQVKKIETVVGQWFADWTPNLSTEAKISTRDYHSEPKNNASLPLIQLTFIDQAAPTGTRRNTNLNMGTERSRHTNILDTKTVDGYFGATWTNGDHEIKGALDYADNKIYNAFLQDTKGNYNFSCVNSSATYTYSFGAINCATATAAQVEAAVFENYTKGRPLNYLVQVPALPGGSLSDGIATFNIKNQGVALQDVYTVNPNLTVQFGVRMDVPIMPTTPIQNTAASAPVVLGSATGTLVRQSGGFGLDNTRTIDGDSLIQPRIGFNYTFDSARPMQLRGGAGLFQGAAATVWISNAYSNTGIATRVVGCGTSGFAGCPVTGGIFSPDPAAQITNFAGAAPAANVDFLQPGLGQPSVWKANLAFEHELPWAGIVASVEFLQSWTNTGIYYQHLNLGAPTKIGTDGRELYYTASALNPACWSIAAARITTGTVCGVDNRNRALNNPAYNNVLLAAKTNQGGGRQATFSFSGRLLKELNWSLAYTYTEATEVSGLTSSVSNSNWAARSVLNPNENTSANSAYLVKDRISSTLSWDHAFIQGYKTRVGLFYEGRTGKPYSWTFSNDANGDGLAGNDLMYIPSAPGSGQVIFQGDTATDKTNENRFWAIVNANPGLLRNAGRVAQRNENYGPWSNSVDVRLSQELPSFFKGHKAVFAFDILNFGNLLNKRWGRIDEIGFASNGGLPRQFAGFVGIDPASGKYVYQVPPTVTDFTTRQIRGESQWAMQATFRYEF